MLRASTILPCDAAYTQVAAMVATSSPSTSSTSTDLPTIVLVLTGHTVVTVDASNPCVVHGARWILV